MSVDADSFLKLLDSHRIIPLFFYLAQGTGKGAAHAHDAFELIFREESGGVIEYPDRSIPFSSHSWTLIAPHVTHRQINQGKYRENCLIFRLEPEVGLPFSYREFPPLPEQLAAASEMRLLSGFGLFPESGWRQMEIASRIRTILAILMDSAQHVGEQDNGRNLFYARQAEQMIVSNGYTDISLDGIAEKLGVSPDHLRHCYRQARGITLNEYRSSVRLDYAEHLLRYSDLQIKEIASRCGFRSVSHFCLFFRAARCKTPAEYRAAMNNEIR